MILPVEVSISKIQTKIENRQLFKNVSLIPYHALPFLLGDWTIL